MEKEMKKSLWFDSNTQFIDSDIGDMVVCLDELAVRSSHDPSGTISSTVSSLIALQWQERS